MDFWSYLGSSVAGGGIGSLLVGWWLKHREKEHDELKRLEKERIDKIAADLERHLKISNPEATNDKIDRLRGDVNRLHDAVERDRERRATLLYSKEVCTNGSKHFILLWGRFFCVNKKVIYDEMKFEQSDKSLIKPKTSRRVNAGLKYKKSTKGVYLFAFQKNKRQEKV